MAHPRMYTDRDPFLKDLRTVCLALPEAVEIEAWGRPTFRAGEKGKIFAIFTGLVEKRYSMVFTPEPGEAPALRADERVYVAKYYPKHHALDITKAAVDWDEVAELVEGSYRQVAAKRLVKALDERDA
jgi:predicted DNA-binding protein (MmcQ/YjbR family)